MTNGRSLKNMVITINNKPYTYENGTTLEAIMKDLSIKAYAATVNNRMRELTYEVKRDSVVQFLDLSNRDAIKVYESTLRFIILMAIRNLYPNSSVKYNYSISRSILVITKKFRGSFNPTSA